MKVEWRKFSYEMIWCSPYLDVRVVRDSYVSEATNESLAHNCLELSDVLSVRGEFDSLDRLFEVMMMKHHSSPYVHEKSSTV